MFEDWCFNGNTCIYLECKDFGTKNKLMGVINDRIFFYSETKQFASIIISGQIENIIFS